MHAIPSSTLCQEITPTEDCLKELATYVAQEAVVILKNLLNNQPREPLSTSRMREIAQERRKMRTENRRIGYANGLVSNKRRTRKPSCTSTPTPQAVLASEDLQILAVHIAEGLAPGLVEQIKLQAVALPYVRGNRLIARKLGIAHRDVVERGYIHGFNYLPGLKAIPVRGADRPGTKIVGRVYHPVARLDDLTRYVENLEFKQSTVRLGLKAALKEFGRKW